MSFLIWIAEQEHARARHTVAQTSQNSDACVSLSRQSRSSRQLLRMHLAYRSSWCRRWHAIEWALVPTSGVEWRGRYAAVSVPREATALSSSFKNYSN